MCVVAARHAGATLSFTNTYAVPYYSHAAGVYVTKVRAAPQRRGPLQCTAQMPQFKGGGGASLCFESFVPMHMHATNAHSCPPGNCRAV
jgi:hypothetical protein